ncbi:hypothetical protein HYT01_00600 [Candidatus Giovannonibacteria bacterium]|nr:hypothetical protein [Candidatus Giovannonibacteria bacterium]
MKKLLKIKASAVKYAAKTLDKSPTALHILMKSFLAHRYILKNNLEHLYRQLEKYLPYPMDALGTKEYKSLAMSILPIYFAHGWSLPEITASALAYVPDVVKDWDAPIQRILNQAENFGHYYAGILAELRDFTEPDFYLDILVLVHIFLSLIELEEREAKLPARFHRARSHRCYY